jgi:putative transposase
VRIFEFIAAKKAEHSIKTMCRVLGVSRSGFHAWVTRPPSPRALEDPRLTTRIGALFALRRKVYGSPRIWADLVVDDGERIGRKRVERLMRQAGLSGLQVKKCRPTTIQVPGVRVADDLLDRDFAAGAPNRCWVADITYLRTWEGWLYLVAVQDLFSRRIVGWSMADHMRTELVSDALGMALAHRRPDPELIWHSDQGSQFVSLAFGQQARAAGSAQSMGSRGDCFDNAVAESFFATLKKELIHRRSWPTKAELRTEVFDYIEVFYNRQRRPRHARHAIPARLREQHSEPGRDQSRRFAARVPHQDQVHCTNHDRDRLINPCPPKRGNSTLSVTTGWSLTSIATTPGAPANGTRHSQKIVVGFVARSEPRPEPSRRPLPSLRQNPQRSREVRGGTQSTVSLHTTSAAGVRIVAPRVVLGGILRRTGEGTVVAI